MRSVEPVSKFATIVPVICFLWLMLCTAASAETLRPAPGTNLSEIIHGAANGDLVELAPGDYSGPVIVDGKKITIIGASTSATRISGNAQAVAVAVNDGELVLENLTLAGNGQTDIGFIGQSGTLTGRSLFIADVKQLFIQQQSKTVTLDKVELRGSFGRGVLLTDGAAAKLNDVVMAGVEGDVGIFISNQSRLTMEAGAMSDLRQHAIYSEDSELTLQGVKADKIGGRVLMAPKSAKVTLSDLSISNVQGDTAIFAGGGGALEIEGGKFSNLAGSGVYVDGATLTIANAHFDKLGGTAIVSINGDAQIRSNTISSAQSAVDIRSGAALIDSNGITKTAKGHPAIRISEAAAVQITANRLGEIDYGIAVTAAPGSDISIRENIIILASASGLQVLGSGQPGDGVVNAEDNLIIATGRDAVTAAQSGTLILRNNQIFSRGEMGILAVENAKIEAQGNLIGAANEALYNDPRSAATIIAQDNRVVFGRAPIIPAMDVEARLSQELSKKAELAEPVRQAFLALFEGVTIEQPDHELSKAIETLEARYQAIGAAVADYRSSSAFPAIVAHIASPLPIELADPASFHRHIVDLDGRLHLQFRDLAFAERGHLLEVVRSYSDGGGADSPFGPGWSWNWGQKIVRADSQRLTFRQPDGAEVTFTKASGNLYVPLIGLAGSSFAATPDGGFERNFADGKRDVYSADGLISRANREGPVQFLTYGENGRLQAVDAVSGQNLRFAYDNGRLIRCDGPEGSGAFIKYGYEEGRLSLTEDVLGRRTRFSYDAAGLLARIVFSDGGELAISRDSDGRVTGLDGPGTLSSKISTTRNIATSSFNRQIEDGAGVTAVQTATPHSDGSLMRAYGVEGGDIQTQLHTGKIVAALGEGEAVTLAMAEPNSPILANGGLISGALDLKPDTIPADRRYDGRGFPKTVTADGETINIVHDISARTAKAVGADGTEKHGVSYDAVGQITAITGGENGGKVLRYDAAGRLSEIAAGSDMRKIAYSAEGLVRSIEGPDVNWTYSYDAAGRVRRVENGGQFVTIEYDRQGNPKKYQDEKGNTFTVERERPGHVKIVTAQNAAVQVEFGSDGFPREVIADGKSFAKFRQEDRGQIIVEKGDGLPETVSLAASGAEAPAFEIPLDTALGFLNLNADIMPRLARSYAGGIPLQMPALAEPMPGGQHFSEAMSHMISPSAAWAGTALAALGGGGLRALGPVLYTHHVVEYLEGKRSTGRFIADSAIFGAALAFPGNPVSVAAAAHGLGSLIGEALAEHVINEINDPNSRDGRIYERLFGVYREEHANHPCTKGINCDCQGIESGLLTGSWRTDCRNCERGIREGCMRAVANGTSSAAAIAASPRCNTACSVHGDNYQPR